MHWMMDLYPEQVRGLTVIETKRAPEGAPFPWLMNKVFHEFNSGAYLVDLGVFVPENCSVTR